MEVKGIYVFTLYNLQGHQFNNTVFFLGTRKLHYLR